MKKKKKTGTRAFSHDELKELSLVNVTVENSKELS